MGSVVKGDFVASDFVTDSIEIAVRLKLFLAEVYRK